MFPIDQGLRALDYPFSRSTTTYALTATSGGASIALPQGAYQAFNSGTSLVALCFGGTATLPASGASAASTFFCPAGAVAGLVVGPGGATLHASAASSSTLYLAEVSR